ncbi:hypothetical protein OQJ19_09165 [Fluoribacter gormanii]|uniref:Uncharacterized protein n=1 Tax=Fluoribacter gormanii TaxID=464 RepID=A0A377GMS6_9GAMM|nr:hypothetical protein [Fluoribacter gormanii]KTD05133.1 hypothetical protein Lgor_0764 [Fluoribacter gormanii]MCW8445567.1 hypothetical protein [Fluoribacter gormanii]MCW8470818.1 hypothetical protein [Fluoribacter gormanii]SIR00424.1 hypothetical protein SAMN05421777_10587 [Fluoribacter gormanii]STO26058.1 Uncharacterised protein [Fluoribacter gormanii]
MAYEKQHQTNSKPVTMYNLLNWSTIYRGYNALVATLVMFQYVNNPEAAAIEYLPDVAIHAFEAIAPNSLNNLAAAANFARGIQAGLAFFSGNSTIPSVANVTDVFNHGVNIYHRLS